MRKPDVGVIAQEIAEVMPHVVAQKTDGYLAVKYETSGILYPSNYWFHYSNKDDVIK